MGRRLSECTYVDCTTKSLIVLESCGSRDLDDDDDASLMIERRMLVSSLLSSYTSLTYVTFFNRMLWEER